MVVTENWGLIAYQDAYQRQRTIVTDVLKGAPNRLILCQHPPVITIGRMTKPDSLLFSKEELNAQGVELHPIDRGGDVTLHAPGQLVVYTIFNLNHYGKDLKAFMQNLEQVAVDLLKDFGILAISIPGKRGVFVGNDKIVSIGIGVRQWVTYHGLGINVSTDLNLFRFIRPCGLDVAMTSMNKVLRKEIPMKAVEVGVVKCVERIFR